VTYYCSNAGSGTLFVDSSNAGSANFIVASNLAFYGTDGQKPSVANATITNDGGYTSFSFGGTAANAVIINQHGGGDRF
jgi:hypothetical protein